MKPKKKKVPSVRKTWTVNPVTRVKGSDKKYSRRATKKNFKKELDES